MANLYGYNTSTARKLSEFDSMYGRDLQKELRKENKEPDLKIIKAKAAPRAKAKAKFSNVLLVILCFAMAFTVASGYVAINEADNEISKLVDEYNSIVASNQAIQVKIDKAVDLKELQTVAGEKFGMVKPERYQMFYVDLEMDDFAESKKDEKHKEEGTFAGMGAPGIITGTLNLLQ